MKKGPFILIGIIGLLPVIGLFLGSYLIYVGFKRREIAFKFLGILDVCVTLLIAYPLLQPVKPGSMFYQLAEVSSVEKMNNVVRSLELYKLQEGVYPDSLLEITKVEPIFTDLDPLHSVARHKAQPLKYYKTSTGYYLFSSGMDEEEFTSDDLLPSSPSSPKFGLRISPRHDSLGISFGKPIQ